MSPVKQFFKPAGATLVLLVGARRIDGAVRRGAAWAEEGRIAIAAGPEGWRDAQDLAAAIRGIAVPSGVAHLRVLVADSWLASASVPWSAAMRRTAEAGAAARLRLSLAGFDVDAHDTLRLDDAPFGAPRLALAYPAPLMAVLAQLAASAGARLDSVLALSAAGWSLARSPLALALLDEGLVVLARGRGRHIDELTVRSAEGADLRSVRDTWQRQCLRDPQLAALEQAPLLDLSAAAAAPQAPFVPLELPAADVAPGLRLAAAVGATSALDAVQGGPALGPRRAMALAAAVLLAVAGVGYAVRADSELQALQQARQAPLRSTAAAPRAAAWTPAEVTRVQAVNVAVRELNLPFAAILRALEPPKDLRVAVLSLSTSASTSGTQASRVKIVAEARTGGEMARYVAFVAERKPFTGAYLVEHEIDEAGAERPYRFTLEASWND